MLRLIAGRFHPELEEALLAEVRALKEGEPLSHVALVVPSNWLRSHITRLFATKLGPTAGIHFVSLFAFVLRTAESSAAMLKGIGGPKPDRLVLQHIVRRIIRKNSTQLPRLSKLSDFRGAAGAALRAIEDLRDSSLSPEDIRDALEEFDERDGMGILPMNHGRDGHATEKLLVLRELNLVYSEYRRLIASCAFPDHRETFRVATENAAKSDYLRLFKHIIFYGFYDFTTVQLDFVKMVFKICPATFFMPYVKNSMSYAFAEDMYDILHGQACETKELYKRKGPEPDHLEDIEISPGVSRPESFGSAFPAREGVLAERRPDAPHPAAIGPLAESLSEDVDRLLREHALKVVDASGTADEVWWTAKEILKLMDAGRCAPEDIAVVARTLEPYALTIDEVFRANRIPYVTCAQEPILRYPLAKTIRELASLIREDFPRAAVIEVLSSPYINRARLCGVEGDFRTDIWDVLSRKLAITSGADEWKQRLANFIARGRTFRDEEPDDEARDDSRLAIRLCQARYLLAAIESLERRLASLPERSGYATFSNVLRRLLEEIIALPDEDKGGTGFQPVESHGQDGRATMEMERAVLERILEGLDGIHALNALGEEVGRNEFIGTFVEYMRDWKLPLGLATGRGVRVLDSMNARGIGASAVFLLGMNARVFPRVVREEPLLKDSVRRKLSETIAVRIPEKLRGFDEEKLLFQLLLNSARDRLYLLYQRSDEEGAVQTRSQYIDAICGTLALASGNGTKGDPQREASACGWHGHPGRETPGSGSPCHPLAIKVPRGLANKLLDDRIGIAVLTPMEAGLALSLSGRAADAEGLLAALSKDVEAFRHSMQALEVTEGYGELSLFDGIGIDVEKIAGDWHEKGFSPTSLEKYVRCPFAFFVEKVMRIEALEEPEGVEAPEKRLVGKVCHDVLRRLYEHLCESQYFKKGGTGFQPVESHGQDGRVTFDSRDDRRPDLMEMLRESATEEFSKFEREWWAGYPLVWEIEKGRLVRALEAFVPADVDSLIRESFAPVGLELWGNCEIQLPGLGKIKFLGRIDRLDVTRGTGRFVVCDYKSGKPDPKNISALVLKCERLQLPLYIRMAEEYLRNKLGVTPEPSGSVARFAFVMEATEKGYDSCKREIPGDFWAGNDVLRERLAALIKFIERGFFPIVPDDYHWCTNFCPSRTVCRRSHPPSRFRAENSREVLDMMVKLGRK